MKKNNVFFMAFMVLMLSMAMVFTACSDDDPKPAEALITEFTITNAGGGGDLRIEGVIDGLTILVVVPFETDVTALVCDIKTSEGATVSPPSGSELDYTEPRNFVVTNGDLENIYTVTVEKADPTDGTIIDISIISATSGEEYQSDINQGARSILVTYNELQSPIAVIDDITFFHAGTVYNTSTGTDTLNLGVEASITVTFAGAETVYTIETNVTEAGFNPDNTEILLDRSGAAGLVPSIIDNENNRGADFDGRYVYVVSRKDGNHIYYWDVENPSADPKTLILGDVVQGGTWLISDIRVVNGNIYVSNMNWNDGAIFKVYKWEGFDDTNPSLVLSYTIESDGVRLGDAISVIGSPPSNGYIFASNFPILPDGFNSQASEFYVWSFNNGKAGEAEIIPINPIEGLRMGQYGRVNTIPGVDDLLMVTGAEMGVAVMDYSGNILAETAEPMVQTRSYDPRVWEYNGGRYLSFTVNREWEGQGAYFQVLNITDGADMVEAIQNITAANIENMRVYHHLFGAGAAVWVGATHGFGFGDNGKPRTMSFALQNGFIVTEFSN